MQKRINERFGLITFTIVFLAGLLSYGASAGNSDSSSVAVGSSSAAPNMQQSANAAKSGNGMAGALSKVVGAAHIGLGATQINTGMAANAASMCGCAGMGQIAQGVINIGMGALSFMQAGQHGGAENGAAITGIDTSAWNNPFGNPNTTPTENLLVGDPTKDKDLAAAVNIGKFNDLKTRLTTSGIGGIKLDAKSGKIIDTNTGKTYDVGQMSDAGKMAEAGFSAGDIASAMSDAAKIEKAAMKKLGIEGIGAATAENGFTEGDAGGAAVNGGSMEGSAGGASGYGRRGLASGSSAVKIPSNQIAGLTKNFNGERIGVSAENIFNMMARRYKTKEKQNSFFEPSELVKMPQ